VSQIDATTVKVGTHPVAVGPVAIKKDYDDARATPKPQSLQKDIAPTDLKKKSFVVFTMDSISAYERDSLAGGAAGRPS
jgi:hypothetical protein